MSSGLEQSEVKQSRSEQQTSDLGARDAEKLGLQGLPAGKGLGRLHAPFPFRDTRVQSVSHTTAVFMPVSKSCHVLTRQVRDLGMCF